MSSSSYQTPQTLVLSGLPEPYTSVRCTLSVRMQTIYFKSSFSIPYLLRKEPHVPCALRITVKQGEFPSTAWSSRFYCVLTFRDESVMKTPAIASTTPCLRFCLF